MEELFARTEAHQPGRSFSVSPVIAANGKPAEGAGYLADLRTLVALQARQPFIRARGKWKAASEAGQLSAPDRAPLYCLSKILRSLALEPSGCTLRQGFSFELGLDQLGECGS